MAGDVAEEAQVEAIEPPQLTAARCASLRKSVRQQSTPVKPHETSAHALDEPYLPEAEHFEQGAPLQSAGNARTEHIGAA